MFPFQHASKKSPPFWKKQQEKQDIFTPFDEFVQFLVHVAEKRGGEEIYLGKFALTVTIDPVCVHGQLSVFSRV